MTLDEIDKTGLIRESYQIDGITQGECRSVFLDWALKLPMGTQPKDAIGFLIETYAASAPDHPMNSVLKDGLGSVAQSGRRGGRKSRLKE